VGIKKNVKMLLDVKETLRNNFKSETAKHGKDMIEVFRWFMNCFINHPEKCINFLNSLIPNKIGS